MKYGDLENQMRDTLANASASVDTDVLIANLGLPIDPVPSASKKPIWLIGALLGLLLLSGIFAWTYLSGLSDKTTHSSTITNSLNEGNNKSSATIIANGENEENLESKYTQKEEVEEEKISEASTIYQSKTAAQTNQNRSTNTIAKRENQLVATAHTVDNTSSSKSVLINNMNAAKHNPQTSINNTSAASTVSPALTTNGQIKELTETLTRGSIPEVAILERSVYEVAPLNERDDIPEPECPSFSNKSSWKFSLLAEAGYMIPSKELNGQNSVFDMRSQNEESKEGMQFGLHGILRQKNKPWYIRAGLAYTRIAEQMNEEYMYTELDTTFGIISITQSQSGDTITAIYGDVITETTYSGRSRKHYYLHLWDVPVAFGYEKGITESLYLGGEIGANLNIRTGGSGSIFRDINEYDDFSEVASSNTSVGMSYFGGVHLGYRLSNRLSIRLSARMRYYPKYFDTNNLGVTQRYKLTGLHAGYVYSF